MKINGSQKRASFLYKKTRHMTRVKECQGDTLKEKTYEQLVQLNCIRPRKFSWSLKKDKVKWDLLLFANGLFFTLGQIRS